jgi:hypothetical protein
MYSILKFLTYAPILDENWEGRMKIEIFHGPTNSVLKLKKFLEGPILF